MLSRPIEELRCHPEQLLALKAAGLIEPVSIRVPPSEPPTFVEAWQTAFYQLIKVSKYLPEEGLFLPSSKAAREAEKIEAGDERRREQLKRYKENFGT